MRHTVCFHPCTMCDPSVEPLLIQGSGDRFLQLCSCVKKLWASSEFTGYPTAMGTWCTVQGWINNCWLHICGSAMLSIGVELAEHTCMDVRL